jgi:hypothetical protein
VCTVYLAMAGLAKPNVAAGHDGMRRAFAAMYRMRSDPSESSCSLDLGRRRLRETRRQRMSPRPAGDNDARRAREWIERTLTLRTATS